MFWLALVYLSWLRFQDLGLKPIHHDEAVNGWFTQQLWQNGWPSYDPSNFHGPLLFNLFGLGEALGGWGIISLRAVTVAFSVFWLWYLWSFWKRYQWTARWFLIVVALSPGFLFFSRSAIHEMPFLFFLTLALGGLTELFHYRQSRGWRSLIWGLAGVILLKETWVIMAAALVVAAIPILWARRKTFSWSIFKLQFRSLWLPEAPLHFGLALSLVVLLYTGFFQKPQGLMDLVRTYLPWLRTGVSAGGHEKPFLYWLDLLWSFEKPLLFLFVGLLSSALLFWRRLSATGQWLLLAAVLNVLFYSIIPYKTPWCLLAVYGPLIFVFGLVRTELHWVALANPVQVGLTLAAVVALIFQWPQNEDLNFRNPAQKGHPYVYVQTDKRLQEMINSLQAAAEKDPSLYSRPFQQGGTEAWPLAWALSRFRHQVQQPIREGLVPNAFLVIYDAKDEGVVTDKFPVDLYEVTRFPIRDSREDSKFMVLKTAHQGPLPPATKLPDENIKAGER